MREYKPRSESYKGDNHTERSVSIRGRINRYRLSDSDRERQRLAFADFLFNDWRSWVNKLDSAIPWDYYRVGISIASVTAFSFGIGQIYLKLRGIG